MDYKYRIYSSCSPLWRCHAAGAVAGFSNIGERGWNLHDFFSIVYCHKIYYLPRYLHWTWWVLCYLQYASAQELDLSAEEITNELKIIFMTLWTFMRRIIYVHPPWSPAFLISLYTHIASYWWTHFYLQTRIQKGRYDYRWIYIFSVYTYYSYG